MKKILKKLFNRKTVDYLKAIKLRYFPSEHETNFFRTQNELLKKRMSFYSNYVKPGELYFDIGANIGNRVEALLGIGAKVVAVEPQETCYKELEKKFGNKISIVKKGIGAEEGELDFYISDASVLSSFASEWIQSVKDSDRFAHNQWNTIVKTRIITLDQLISEFGIPAFIKIDVEGFEIEVLKGLTQPIKTMSFEYTVPEQISTALACVERLQTINENIEFNYCVGESMELALDKWVSPVEMNTTINLPQFITSGFGDIYVKKKGP